MSVSLISLILIFGIIQGTVTAFSLLFSSTRKNIHNRILAFFLLTISITLAPSVLGQLGLVEAYPFLYFLPLDLSLFLFPLLFLYSLTILGFKPSFRSEIKHLIPGIIFWGYFVLVWLLTMNTTEKGRAATSVFFFEVQFTSQLIWIVSIFYYSLSSLKLLKESSSFKLSKSQKSFIPWLKCLLILLIGTGFMEVVALFVGKYYGYWKGSPIDDWLGFSFTIAIKCIYAIVLYIIAFIGYSRFRKISYSFPGEQSDKTLLSRITSAVEGQKHYLNPDFSLSDLAEIVNAPAAYVSSALNNDLNLSFNDFINQYRVETVKEKLLTDAPDKYTLQYLAEQSGFNSKTTFYRAFQKFTNQSPSEYLKEVKESS